jgi:hypothetical protein
MDALLAVFFIRLSIQVPSLHSTERHLSSPKDIPVTPGMCPCNRPQRYGCLPGCHTHSPLIGTCPSHLATLPRPTSALALTALQKCHSPILKFVTEDRS